MIHNLKTILCYFFCFVLAVSISNGQTYNNYSDDPVNIGSRLELFIDSLLIDKLEGVELRLHTPVQLPLAESPLKGDYMTVIKDGDIFRAYYRGMDTTYTGVKRDGHAGELTCYAESEDGHEWRYPSLGIYKINGTYENNAILAGQPPFSHNFSPFIDTRQGIPVKERFKALAGIRSSGLFPFVSKDGIHWEKASEKPVITDGRFDSQNVAFWSEVEQKYVCYFRTSIETPPGERNLRSISRSTSTDFINWTNPIATNPNLPGEHLYTSQTHPYFRATHIYIALPTRYQHGLISGRSTGENTGSTDIMFMTSRAGSVEFDRIFHEAFIRPGIDPARWENRANYVALNVVPTGPAEMSIYNKSGHRYVLRTDGFVSIRAGAENGEMVTRPLIFKGSELIINYSTSTGGMLKVEIEKYDGTSVPGFELNNCIEIVGDEISHVVKWKDSSDLSQLAGTPVRLRFVMRDCDLYSFRFQ